MSPNKMSQHSNSCNNYAEYPSNLIRPLPQEQLNMYHDLLDQHSSSLCDESRSSISIWDLRDVGRTFGPECRVQSHADLAEYMESRDTDPLCRHIFIKSKNSTLPLDCSVSLLKSVLTYHQVAPFFLDQLLTFGKQLDMIQLDPIWCTFKDHSAHSVRPHLAAVPSRGRSSNQIQHSFLLRTAERVQVKSTFSQDRSSEQEPHAWNWRVRQVAAYHSFDLASGKVVWITAKGNNSIKNEIMNASPKYPAFDPEAGYTGEEMDIVAASLEAALETHLVYFRWCESTWRWFTRDIEDHIRQELKKARTHPIGRAPFDRTLPRSGTGFTSPTVTEFPRDDNKLPTKNSFLSVLKFGRAKNLPVCGMDKSTKSVEDEESMLYEAKIFMEQEAKILGLFSHKDLQTLTVIHHRLEEGRAILELNHSVLGRVCQRYRDIASSCPKDTNENTKRAICDLVSGFIRATEEIMKDLKTWETVLMSLRTTVEQGDRPMIESILQLRGSHASRMFEEHAHQSSITMEKIADSTRIITYIAFSFLSVQIGASLAQSGIFDWHDDGGSGCGPGWSFRTTALVIFFIITVLAGAAMYLSWWGWKRRSAMKDPGLPIS